MDRELKSARNETLRFMSTAGKWTTVEFIERMLEAVPDLRPVYQEHIDEFDELLSHVFMGRVDDFVTDLLVRDHLNGTNDGEVKVANLLAIMEDGLKNGDEDVDNMICVSFLEYMMSRDEYTYK